MFGKRKELELNTQKKVGELETRIKNIENQRYYEFILDKYSKKPWTLINKLHPPTDMPIKLIIFDNEKYTSHEEFHEKYNYIQERNTCESFGNSYWYKKTPFAWREICPTKCKETK